MIDEQSCRLNANFSETRFNYAEPFMEEMLQKNDKMITNYLSFQNALNDLNTIFSEFMYVYRSMNRFTQMMIKSNISKNLPILSNKNRTILIKPSNKKYITP
ncbi:hypothetical protein RF11_11670 [Thelohanellus kitauei]|uniref:Uncharacterized protein n=1 Tax=Thelohanellus kitauei TaxID=669202 RepID=A0A0C2IZV0_THEKT|nr:hypothetical protein RF11_11670 [Thelohanellus kitauei]